MTTAWAHLPNAKLIDAVLADVAARPLAWGAIWSAAWGTARDAALFAAWDIAWDAAWNAEQAAAQVSATQGAAWDAAWDVILALIAWDDCARLLDLPSTTLRTMADLCDAPACHQAMLLLPYVLVKEST